MRLLRLTVLAGFAFSLALALPQSPEPENGNPQNVNASDHQVTARIRHSIVADQALSAEAHNVKIVTRDGIVTLRGVVRSGDEARAVLDKAAEVAGSNARVVNQLLIAPPSKY
jgi:osmotically-inducible protein OsmY